MALSIVGSNSNEDIVLRYIIIYIVFQSKILEFQFQLQSSNGEPHNCNENGNY